MASNRASIAPGDHANSSRAVNNAQQRPPYFDARRGNVLTTDDTIKNVRYLIEKNQELQRSIATLTEKALRLETERDKVIAERVMIEVNAAQAKTEEVKEQYEGKLAESLQNYEDAKVVVLTYKTQNIRLQSVAEHNETEIANLKERVKALKAAESSASKIQQLEESLKYSEERAANLEREIGRLQQSLHIRSQENNSLSFQIENIAKSFHLTQEQIQLMIQQALNQQQLQSVLYQCDTLRDQLHEKNMVLSNLQHELAQFHKLRENNFASDEDYQYLKMKVEEQNKAIFAKSEEIKRKDVAIKGLQDILKKEQQSHQEKLAMQGENSPQWQALNKQIQELNKRNDALHNKVGELSQKCEHAETEYAILKSVDLESRKELQGYKEQVIALEHDLRKGKQLEGDLYKELDGALKDLEGVSNRYKSLQNENIQLKQRTTFTGMDDSQLVHEIALKNQQVEIMHSQLKDYAEKLDKEKRKVEMLCKENQQLQQPQQQHLQYNNPPPPLPPRSSTNMPSNRTARPIGNPQWDGLTSPVVGVHNRDSPMSQQLPPRINAVDPSHYNNEGFRKYSNTAVVGGQPLNHSYPTDRAHGTMSPGYHSQPPVHTEEPPPPCPLCGKSFSTVDELMQHAALCC